MSDMDPPLNTSHIRHVCTGNAKCDGCDACDRAAAAAAVASTAGVTTSAKVGSTLFCAVGRVLQHIPGLL